MVEICYDKNIANWDISNITELDSMFGNCILLSNLSPLSNWNTGKVQDMSYMFNNCTSLTNITPLSNWNTTSLTNNTVLIQNVGTVVDSGGTVGTSSQMQPYPFPMSGYTKHWEVTNTGDLKYRCDSTTAIVQIWFEYTKTTD